MTNRSNNSNDYSNARSIVALQDVGESDPEKLGLFIDNQGNQTAPPVPNFINNPNARPHNTNNDFNPFGISSGNFLF